MGSALSDECREDVWEALSNAFIDNEVHYEFIARRIVGVPVAELKEIFFTEVAPYCGQNLLTVIPPIWAGFDRQRLVENIRAMQARGRRCLLARWRMRCAIAFCRIHFRGIWAQIEAELGKKMASAYAEHPPDG